MNVTRGLTTAILAALLLSTSAGRSSAQTDFSWNINGDGLWRLDGNWDQSGFPNDALENAIILNATNALDGVVVALGPSVTNDVGDVTINDSGNGADQNTLSIDNNTFLDVHGDVTNNGIITVNSGGNSTLLRLDGSDLVISGLGTLNLGALSVNGIASAGSAQTLTNSAAHTIAGGGNVGLNTIGITNAGTIDANLTAVTMTVDPEATLGLTNTGTLRATGGGILRLTGSNGGSFDNSGGVIEAAGAGSEVTLFSSTTIAGGTLRGTGGGLVHVNASDNAFFTDVSFEGSIQGDNNSDFGISGTIANSGTISIASGGNATDLEVQAGGAALNGSGKVVLSGPVPGINGVSNALLTHSATHTIEGRGNLGQNTIGIDNQGLINANVAGQILTVDPDDEAGAGSGLTNTGTLQASGGGILALTGSNGGSFDNVGGLIEAAGAGSEVQLSSAATVTGGTLRGTGGGIVRVNGSQDVFFTDVSFEGSIQGDNNSDFGISGTIANSGTISMTSVGNATDIEVQAGGATLDGSGKVVLAGPVPGINGVSNALLTHSATHTIEGRGNLGQNTIGIDNQGLINANVAGQILTVDPDDEAGAGSGLTNTGTLQASGGGILALTGSGGGSFDNSGGVIEASGADSEVQLSSSASVTGGTLRGTGGGIVRVNGSQDVFFTDVSFEGSIQGDNNSDFGISGTIANSGTISMTSVGNATDIEVQAGGATLDGSGKVVLAGPVPGINGVSNALLTHSATHTIEGRGNLGQNTIGIDNQGLINANVAGQILTVDPDDEAGAGSGLTNTGTLQASGGGILALTGSGGGSFDNSGGVIEASGADSEVQLSSSASVTGGTLRGTGGGIVRVNGSQDVFFTDVSFEGTIQGDNNSDFGIGGTIANSGTITITSGGNATDIEVQAGGATLDGSGKVVLAGPIPGINGVSNALLTHSATHTIEGRGNLGQNTIGIDNQGTIDANAGTMTIDPDAVNNFANSGTTRASGGGTAVLTGSNGGTFTNSGTFEALDGSALNMVSGAVLTNNVAGVLTGGTYRVIDDGSGASMSLTGAAIGEIAAGTEVVLSGLNSALSSGGVIPEDSTTVNRGTARLLNNRDYTMTVNVTTFDNFGLLELGGGTLSGVGLVQALANNGGGEFFGFGTLDGPLSNGGLVRAAGGTLTIKTIIGQGGGTVQVDPGASLDVSDPTLGNSSTDRLFHNGVDLNLGGNDFLVGVDYNNANFGTGNDFNPRARVTGSGQIIADPVVTQSISGDVVAGSSATPTLNFGNLRVGDSSTLSYAVDNNGAGGPLLRGALQTDNSAGNGGNISAASLSGSGVTAQNFGPVAAGAATSSFEVTFAPASEGGLSGQHVAVPNNFDNVDGQVLAISGAAYAAAVAEVTPTTVDFGIVHVGDVITPQSITISNQLPLGAFSEDLRADNFNATGDALIAGGSPTTLTLSATQSDNSLGASIDTATAGAKSGTITMDLASTGEVQGVPVAGLGELDLGSALIQISAQVNEFAVAEFVQVAGSGALSLTGPNEYLLDLGTVLQGAPHPIAELGVLNNVASPADVLSGDFTIPSSALVLTGFTDFFDLPAGNSLTNLFVELDTANLGTFGGQILLDPRSENASGFSGSLSQVTVNITGSVELIPEPAAVGLLLSGLGLTLIRRRWC